MKAGKKAGEVQAKSDVRNAFDFIWMNAGLMGISYPGTSVIEAFRKRGEGAKNGPPRKPKPKPKPKKRAQR